MRGMKDVWEIKASSYWEAVNELRFHTDPIIDAYEVRDANNVHEKFEVR